MPTTAPQEIIDALVRAEAIVKETNRLDAEARALRDSTSLYDVARLGHIEKRLGELLDEMKKIDVETRHLLPPPPKKRSRIFSWLGLGKATLSIMGVVVSFATNPIIVLVIVCALFYETHAVAL